MRVSDTGVSWRVGRRRAVRALLRHATMNRHELIDRVALAAELPKPAAARAVDATLELIQESLSRGEEVRLSGFGRFHLARYTGRRGVNPRTGEPIQVASVELARFTPGARLKRAVR
jgi:DNA-binding protein HU-beta